MPTTTPAPTMAAARRQRLGVTLVESAVVVAVLALVATRAAPGLQELIETRRLTGVATELASDVHQGRSEAVARNVPVRLTFQADAAEACYLLHTGAAAQCRCTGPGPARCDGDARLIKAVRLPAPQRIAVQSNAASLLFDPVQGTATPAGTLRVLDARGRAVHHVVNVMGRVRTCSPPRTLPGYRAC